MRCFRGTENEWNEKRLSDEKDLNLAQKERSGHGLGPAALEALFLAVLVGLFCRFGVINVIAKADAAESAATQAEDKLREMKSETSRFRKSGKSTRATHWPKAG